MATTRLDFALRKTLQTLKVSIRNFSKMKESNSTTFPGKKVNVENVSLHYEQVGNGDHAVLLLPGALGSTRNDFAPQLERLDRKKLTIVAWDPPGYGFSRPPDRVFDKDFFQTDARLAAALMRTLGFQRYSLVGWSDGGITSLILAAREKEAVRKMVVFGANAYITDKDMEAYRAIEDVDKWSAKMKAPMVDLYGEEYFRRAWKEWVQLFDEFYLNGGNICKEMLPDIRCPTLIIHGQKDPLVPEEHAQYLHEKIKGSRLHLLPEGKHNLHLRYANEFNKLVENFLCN